MTRVIVGFALVFALCVAAACGKPTMEMVFNTSTETFPVNTDEDAQALAAIGGSASGLTSTSVARIPMQSLGDAKAQAYWLNALVLQAAEGDLRFIQLAKCYVQPRSQGGQPTLVGSASAEDVSADGKSIKFHTESGVELSGVLRSPFMITIMIEGDRPISKVSISAELKIKAKVSL